MFLLAAVSLLGLPAARAQSGTPARDFVRPDGTLDLAAAPAGPLDLTGLDVRMGADGALYAGGSFSAAGGVAARNVARWNGTAWTSLGSGLNGSVSALALAPGGLLYAGGSFEVTSESTMSNVAQWNGTA